MNRYKIIGPFCECDSFDFVLFHLCPMLSQQIVPWHPVLVARFQPLSKIWLHPHRRDVLVSVHVQRENTYQWPKAFIINWLPYTNGLLFYYGNLLGCWHHLHGLGNFLNILDRFKSNWDGFQCGHISVLLSKCSIWDDCGNRWTATLHPHDSQTLLLLKLTEKYEFGSNTSQNHLKKFR